LHSTNDDMTGIGQQALILLIGLLNKAANAAENPSTR
jgi:hypothetical protein